MKLHWLKFFCATLGGIASAHIANAEQYVYSMSGVIQSTISVDRNFDPVDVATNINVGDEFLFTGVFDTTKYSVTSLYDSDPSVNIYYGSLSEAVFIIGGYTYSSDPYASIFSSAQIWDDRNVGSVGPVDSFSISGVMNVTGLDLPVYLGSNFINLTFNNNNFDNSATARSSDFINDVVPLDRFGSKTGSFGFINTSTYLQSSYVLSNIRTSLTPLSPVPETGTWAMLVIGFGISGFAMRTRRRPVVCSLVG